MHAESAGGRNLITISFTALLYGVVIDAALHRFHSLAFTPANILLVLALLLVIQDFFFYHEDMKLINISFLKARNAELTSMNPEERLRAEAERRRCERVLFFWDGVLLSAWYTLALAAQSTLRTYMIFLAVFFASVAFWGKFCPKLEGRQGAPAQEEGLWKKYRHTHWPVAVFTGLVAIAAWFLVPEEVGRVPALSPADASHEVGSGPAAGWSSWYLILLVPLVPFAVWRCLVYWPYLKGRIDKAASDNMVLVASPGAAAKTEEITLEIGRGNAEIKTEIKEMKEVLGSLVVCRFQGMGKAQDPVPTGD